MRKTRYMAVGALGLAAALALSACGSGGNSSGDNGNDAASGKGKTITVWLMNGDLQDETMAAINKEFTKKTGAKVKVEKQEWAQIQTKVTTALTTSTPPDVIDVGNTQVVGYAANGGLLDLTKDKADLQQGQSWLPGLAKPGTYDGKLFGVPSFAATRVAIYNKQLWKDAGITEAPTSYSDLKADLDQIKAKNTASDFSAFYMPGQYWYAGLQWVWDAGGDIAKKDGDSWKGSFGSAAAQKGLTAWKKFQNAYSTEASRTLNTDKPDQDQIFADGKTATIIGNNWEIPAIVKDNPKLEGQVGTFPMPGLSGSNQPVFLAGSDWTIPAKTQNAKLAKEWVKIAVSPEVQNKWIFGHDGWIPNSTEGIQKATDSGNVKANDQAFFEAAKKSNSVPSAADWGKIEGDKTLENFFSSIASGSASPADAAKKADSHLAEILNG